MANASIVRWEEPGPVGEDWPARRDEQLARQLGVVRPATATVLTLILWLDASTPEENWSQLAQDLAQGHPSRVVVIHPGNPAGPPSCPVTVVATVRQRAGVHPLLFSEFLHLRPEGTLATHWIDLVQPLVMADLPSYLWWVGLPPAADFPWKLLRAGISHLIIDSSQVDLSRWRSALWRAWAAQMQLEDLQWQRLRPWRMALADLADDPERLQALRRPECLKASWEGGEDDLTLLLGWLAARLNWPRAALADFLVRRQSQPATLALHLPGVEATVRRRGLQVELRPSQDDGAPHLYPAVPNRLSALRDVLSRGHDPLFDQALEWTLRAIPGDLSAS
jgi:glucose-6-phosphate dehydrogenase assembly protein OpcA